MTQEKIKGALHLVINLAVNSGILAFVPLEYKALVLLVFNLAQIVYAYMDPTYVLKQLGVSKQEYLGKVAENKK